MRKILKVLALIGGFGVAQNAAASNLLVNGDFETPVQGAPLFATFNIGVGSSTITGWTVVQGNVDLTKAANYGPGINTLNVSSKQDIDLIGDNRATAGVFGGLSQSFATTAGQTYLLTFDYSHNQGAASVDYAAQVTVADGHAPANSNFSVEVSQVSGPATWALFSKQFTATSDLTLLSIIDTRGGFNGGIYLDDVSVDLVTVSPTGSTPIPGALPLFASGASVLGFFGWRRKKKSAALAA